MKQRINLNLVKNFSNILKFNFTSINKVGIIGTGQMGSGIAYVFNKNANKEVILYDNSNKQIEKCKSNFEKLLDKEIVKQKLDANSKIKILEKFSYTTSLSDLKETDFVVEAVTEDFNIKANLFKELDKITKKQTILASNTSSISITKLAATISKPDKVIGMHFMNPVPVMKLVEVIKALSTSDETFKTTSEMVKLLSKEIVISQDIPGFIINRILMPMINEAICVLYEGIASKEDIDKGMVLGTNVPMGPLTLADFIGLDTCLSIMNVLYSELKDDKYRPCILLTNYVNAGWLGRKTGKGFYKY